MATRIEIITTISDTRATVRQKKLQSVVNRPLTGCQIIDVYTVDKQLTPTQLETIEQRLANPLTQEYVIARRETTKQSPTRLPRSARNDDLKPFTYAIEIGFLPGV